MFLYFDVRQFKNKHLSMILVVLWMSRKETMFCSTIIHFTTYLHFIFNKDDKLMKILDATFDPFAGNNFR